MTDPSGDTGFFDRSLGDPAVFEAAPGAEARRRASLESSLVIVRRRRTLRRGISVILVMTAFACGFAARGTVGGTGARGDREETPRASGGEAMAPVDRESLAEIAPDARRARLFRSAGDGYAAQGGRGLEGAIRCYAQSLDSGEPVRPLEDNWIRLALAQARLMEGGR